jgi:hypothetical protein
MLVGPVREGAQFRFRIHFENLSPAELNLLVYTLRPSVQSRYKLGLGRPLGLGTVRLDPSQEAIAVDFTRRYQPGSINEHLETHLIRVAPQPHAAVLTGLAPGAPSLDALIARCYPGVCYPRVERVGDHGTGQPANGESKLYEWFVANHTGSGSNDNPPINPPCEVPLSRAGDRLEPLPIYKYTVPLGGGDE